MSVQSVKQNLGANAQSYREAITGANGHRYLSNGTSYALEIYVALQVLQDCIITYNCPVGDSVSNKALVAGDSIYGVFSDVVVQSGEVRAYLGVA